MPRTDLEVLGHVHPDPSTWILRFGYPVNPLPMNGSRGTHWATRSRTTANVRRDAGYTALHAKIPPLGRCQVQLTWWVASTRTRDVDNLGAFEKPIYDGLVDARVVADDNPELMDKLRPVIRRLADAQGLVADPCFTLTVTRTLPEVA